MDETDLRDLLAVFVLDAPRRIARIEARVEALERARLPSERAAAAAAAADEAHSLSGAAGTLRLEALAAHSERLELGLRQGDGRVPAARAREQLAAIGALVEALDAGEESAPATRVAGPTDRTVLHVEDNPVNVRLVERALARRPQVRLLSATRAETGLRLARAERPDLILLDLHLPDSSGQEFLSRLRTEPATRELPVVIVSGDTPSTTDALHRLGISDYLTKPVDIGRLLELVDELAPTMPGGKNGGGR